MGVFFTSPRSVPATINTALEDALRVDPNNLVTDLREEAAHRTIQLSKDLSPSFNPWRFGGAGVIAVALLFAAIWSGQNNLPDISKTLMNSFTSFIGLVVGLLGGEAQKT